MQRRTAGLLALVAAAAGLWAFSREGSAPPRAAQNASRDPAGDRPTAGILDTRPAGRGVTEEAEAKGVVEGAREEAASTNSARPVVVVTVLDDASGQAIAGARVMAKVPDSAAEDVHLKGPWVTNGDGRIGIGPVPGDALIVLVRAAGHVPTDWVEVSAGQDEVTVRLETGSRVAGRVVGPAGAAVAGGRVVARTIPDGSLHDPVDCAPDGTFRIDTLPPGRVLLGAAGLVDGRKVVGRAETATGATNVEVSLRLAPVVRIVGPDGSPVTRARLVWRCGSEWGDASVQDRRVNLPRLPSTGICRFDVFDAATVDDVPLGSVHVEHALPLEGELVIRLPPERTITGVVRDEAGNPAGGVAVRALNPDDGDPQAGRFEIDREGGSGRSQADGAFRIGGLGEGVYELSSRAWGNWLESAPVPVPSGAVDVALVVRRGLHVTVQVQDPDGRPLDSARVGAVAADGRTASDLTEVDAPSGARATRGGGGVRIGPLDPSSPLALWVVPPKDRHDLVRRVIVPWTPSDTTVQLERGRLLTGIVRDPGGRPVPYARAEWRTADGDWVGIDARRDARFALRGLPLGTVRVRARHRPAPVWGSAENDAGANGPVGPEVDVDPARTDVTLVVDAGVPLDVRLPYPFADFTTIWLLLQVGDRFVPIEWRWMADGKWTFRGLDAAGTYAVYARTQEGRDVAWRANLRPGPGPVTLDRVVGMAIHVRVLAPPGAKPDVTVAVHGIPLPGERTSDGRWVVHHLLDGTWPVTATADVDGAKWTARADVPAGTSVELELKPAVR
jgi:hypothetical protein